MKKLFVIWIILLESLALDSQQLINAGFENWKDSSNQYLPLHWSVDLEAALHHSPSTNAQQGKFAMVLSTWYSYAKGHLFYGNHKETHRNWAEHTVPFTGRPLKLSGYYRYTDLVNITDSAGGQILLKDVLGDTLAYGEVLLGTAMNWTHFEIPLHYFSNKKTTAISIHFTSREKGSGMNKESYPNRLYLDNFCLLYKTKRNKAE